ELGRALAWCAGYLDEAIALKPATQDLKAMRQRLADRSIVVLVRALEHGIHDPRRLEADVVLAPIRQHTGFGELTARIKAPNRPAKLRAACTGRAPSSDRPPARARSGRVPLFYAGPFTTPARRVRSRQRAREPGRLTAAGWFLPLR